MSECLYLIGQFFDVCSVYGLFPLVIWTSSINLVPSCLHSFALNFVSMYVVYAYKSKCICRFM